MSGRATGLWDKFTQNEKGERVLWQWPNFPIAGWVVFRIAAHLVQSPELKTGFDFIGSAFLFTWAYLEVAKGESYFRRFLGVIIGIFLCLSYFR